MVEVVVAIFVQKTTLQSMRDRSIVLLNTRLILLKLLDPGKLNFNISDDDLFIKLFKNNAKTAIERECRGKDSLPLERNRTRGTNDTYNQKKKPANTLASIPLLFCCICFQCFNHTGMYPFMVQSEIKNFSNRWQR